MAEYFVHVVRSSAYLLRINSCDYAIVFQNFLTLSSLQRKKSTQATWSKNKKQRSSVCYLSSQHTHISKHLCNDDDDDDMM